MSEIASKHLGPPHAAAGRFGEPPVRVVTQATAQYSDVECDEFLLRISTIPVQVLSTSCLLPKDFHSKCAGSLHISLGFPHEVNNVTVCT